MLKEKKQFGVQSLRQCGLFSGFAHVLSQLRIKIKALSISDCSFRINENGQKHAFVLTTVFCKNPGSSGGGSNSTLWQICTSIPQCHRSSRLQNWKQDESSRPVSSRPVYQNYKTYEIIRKKNLYFSPISRTNYKREQKKYPTTY